MNIFMMFDNNNLVKYGSKFEIQFKVIQGEILSVNENSIYFMCIFKMVFSMFL